MAIEKVNTAILADLLVVNDKNNNTNTSEISFKYLFNKIMNEVNETEQVTLYDAALIAAGDVDALHNLTINMAKADIVMQTLVQVRNKALDAYNEIMRITL